MKDQAARNLVLAWAIESSDAEHKLVSAAQRQRLSAVAWAHTKANQPRGAEPSERFLSQRAELLLHEAGESSPAFSTLVARSKGVSLLAASLPVLVVLVGLVLDRIANPHRVDLLSVPLLVIVFWNLLVYAWLLVAALWPAQKTQPTQRTNAPGWLTRWAVQHSWKPGSLPAPWPAAIQLFSTRWMRVASPLFRLRALRLVHCCAAALALGVVGSLYLRGLWVQYQVGWESTFLQAEQVYGLLSILFKPAVWALGLQEFSLAEVRALQWPQAAPADGGARWAHLYAASLMLWVVLPRAVLALVAYARERRLAQRFRPDMAHPYVAALLHAAGASQDSDAGRAGAVLRVFPYSFTVDTPRSAGLQSLAKALLGPEARVVVDAPTAYGEEPLVHNTPAVDAATVREVALFNLSATPEAENHGAFLDSLVQQGHTHLEVWVDVSAYQQRVGAQGGSAERLTQRSALWRDLGITRHLPVRTVHLLQPELPAPGQAAATLAQTPAPVVLA